MIQTWLTFDGAVQIFYCNTIINVIKWIDL